MNKDYNDALDALCFSREAKARMARKLLDGKKAPFRRPRRRIPRLVFVGVAAAMALTVTAGAAGTLTSVGKLFQQVFHLSGNPVQTEIMDKIGKPLNASVSKNGLTITADAVVGDSYSCAIVFSVTKDDGTTFDLVPDEDGKLPVFFRDWRVDLNTDEGSGSNFYFFDADSTDPSIQFVYLVSSDGSLRGHEITLQLEDLTEYVLEKPIAPVDDKLLVSGDWTIKLRVDYENSSLDLPAGQRFTQHGLDAVLTNVSISPIGYHIGYTLDGVLSDGEAIDVPISLTKTDGTVVNIPNGGGGMSYGKYGTAILEKTDFFSPFLPLEDIASITVADVTIPLRASL